MAVAAADIVAVVQTCNCYCSLMGCRQIVAFAFAMHDGFGIRAAMFGSHAVTTAIAAAIVSVAAAASAADACYRSVYVQLL